MIIGIPKEEAKGQTLVALSPDGVTKLIKLGYEIVVESGAGDLASFFDAAYHTAGARIVSATEVWESDIVLCLDTPDEARLELMHPGSVLVSRLNPGAHPELLEFLAKHDITALAMDAIPRISRAQSMDVRSSMSNVAGYRAVIEAANQFGRLFNGQVTAAGKMPPARVYIIGVGVAGLAAIGTASSLGALVSATDVRSDVADQVESLGATFVEIPVQQESSDGYAKEMTAEQQALVNAVYAEQAAQNDIIITTAQIPGKPSPLLLDEEALAGMKPGSVIVDLGASELGSNTALTVPGDVVTTDKGVTIIGYTDLPRRLPAQASQLFGQNLVNFFKLATPGKDGQLVLNEDDEVIRGVTATLDGQIMWPPPTVSVSAEKTAAEGSTREASAPDGATKTTADSVNAAHAAVDTSSPTAKAPDKSFVSVFKRWWWKILLGALGIALILAAPAEMEEHFVVFELAVVVGFYVITNVTHKLHTPLMSVTNAISGIIIVGALLQIGSSNPVVVVLAFIAAALASINIFGGFLVTHRMLSMFEQSSEE